MTGNARPSRSLRRTWAAAVITAGLAGPAFAQSPIDQARAAAAIAEQKAEATITQTVADANKIAKSSPGKAAERLKQAQTGLDLSAGISAAKRKELTATVGSPGTELEFAL